MTRFRRTGIPLLLAKLEAATAKVATGFRQATDEESAAGYAVGHTFTENQGTELFPYLVTHTPTLHPGTALRAKKYGQL